MITINNKAPSLLINKQKSDLGSTLIKNDHLKGWNGIAN